MSPMRKYRRHTQILYALIVALTIWLINPVMAGGGDPEAAKQAWHPVRISELFAD